MVSNTMEDIEINVDDSVDLVVSILIIYTYVKWKHDYYRGVYSYNMIIIEGFKVSIKARFYFLGELLDLTLPRTYRI